MQFSIISLLGLCAIAIAAPAPAAAPGAMDAALVARNWGEDKFCCPSGSQYGCQSCGRPQLDPANRPVEEEDCPNEAPQEYNQCSKNSQNGLANVFACNILDNNRLDVPVNLIL
ncbi:hypothetical protein DOTSEDRAFT_39661 [Dothistroma septosporum NZE10]|uniref:Uncharacterized protein n=1 Tax=Dothistroma septosporum (strain NZE10 / CBS 128990) TaxID=675120 RepID=M2WHQ1_DOTSN|nr:hypothetical protein DOTSEDRAFT_39661 [Dothistroma septosporum NZE10]